MTAQQAHQARLCAVTRLLPGDLVDLYGDRVADPYRADREFSREPALVYDVTLDRPNVVTVDFEGGTVSFPRGHQVPLFPREA